jgi:hypothetical protein
MTGTTGTKAVFAILFRSFTTTLMCSTQLIVLRRLYVFTKVCFAITSMDRSAMVKMNATTGIIEQVKIDISYVCSLAMPWTESEGVTRDVPLDKVCHETTCFLNGCGDIFSAYFRKKLLPCLSALAIISGVFYVFGIAISITLTCKIWSIDQQELSAKAKRKIKERTTAVRNNFGSFRETSTRRTDCEEMPLNAN